MRLWIPAAAVLAALALGCDAEKPAETTPTPAPADKSQTEPVGDAKIAEAMAKLGRPQDVPGKPTMAGGAPAIASGSVDPFAPLSPTPELDKAIADAEKSGDKKALAAAYAKRGAFRTREDDKAGQRVKYRAALSDFRKAVKLDPANEQATSGKGEIETIYSSMGRPIPSDAECDEVSKTGKYTPKEGEGAPALK